MTTGSADGVRREVKRAIQDARDNLGQFEVLPKRDSWLMWTLYAISFMWIWNRRFMTHFVTTIGSTVYSPWELGERGVLDLAIVVHEAQHVYDKKAIGPLWFPAYLFPQVLALLSLVAMATPWYPPAIWSLLAIAALGPWPAPFRVWAELRGYAEGYDVLISNHVTDERAAKAHLQRIFCGWAYWKMSWRWKPIHDKITGWFAEHRDC